MKRKTPPSILLTALFGVSIVLVCFVLNLAALRTARRECASKPQLHIVNRPLWERAAKAATDLSHPTRNELRYEVEYLTFDDLRQDRWPLPLYQAQAPVRVQGQIVAYERNTWVYKLGLKRLLANGNGLPDYHCFQDENKQSKEYRLISRFNKFWRG